MFLENAKNKYEQTVKEIAKLVKFHNSPSLVSITPDDIRDLAENIQRDYDIEVVLLAAEEISKFYANKSLTLGIFLEKCAEIQKARENVYASYKYIKTPVQLKRDEAKQNIEKLKTMLNDSNVLKKLPYNKDFRLNASQITGYTGVKKLPKYEECNSDLPIWGLETSNDGPSLYAKCVAGGQILPLEAIDDPELRLLYERAWTIGLLSEEKARYNELAKRFHARNKLPHSAAI